MKVKPIFFFAFGGATLVVMCALYAGKTAEQLKITHKQIGKELITLRNDHPDLQDRIYSLLDQVGHMFRLSVNSDEKKQEAQRLLEEEKQLVFSLRSENERLKNELSQLQASSQEQGAALELAKQELADLSLRQEEASAQVAQEGGQGVEEVSNHLKEDDEPDA